MKRFFHILAIVFALGGCAPETGNPYLGDLHELVVKAQYPDGFGSFIRAGVGVKVVDINLGNSYQGVTDVTGTARMTVPNGLYRISISDRSESGDIFNGTTDKFAVAGRDASLSLGLKHSMAGSIVFKEIYCGGCLRKPQEGNYQADKYAILHNNDVGVQYLDGLCLGVVCPYNSNSNNPFLTKDSQTGESVLPDFVPVIQAVWQFGGSGTDFPLQPGEDAVVCFNGAIDHTVQYPLSVNLNKPEYFVCYNSTYFANPAYHPAPGDQIRNDHILDVVIKVGQANAYTVSINSPAMVIFRSADMTMKEFTDNKDNIIQVPGSSADQVVKVPLEWVIDAVEVFNGSSSSNTKRLQSDLDAGFVLQSDTFLGHTLFRHTDEDLTESSGFEVLMDTNNSSADFYEREIQSLHE